MDTGLHSLVTLARFHQLPAEADQLTHEFGQPGQVFDDTALLQAANALTLKAKAITLSEKQLRAGGLSTVALPALAKRHDGTYFILARLIENEGAVDPAAGEPAAEPHVLIQDPQRDAPQTLSLSALDEQWGGDLILITRHQGLAERLQQHFDIRWFIPSLVKYRKLFTEVLIASFFLQLFALGGVLNYSNQMTVATKDNMAM